MLVWIKAQQEVEGFVSSMQEIGLDAEETTILKKKSLRKSADGAQLEDVVRQSFKQDP